MWEGFNDSGMDGGILVCDFFIFIKFVSDVKSFILKKIFKFRIELDIFINVFEGFKGFVFKVNNYLRFIYGVLFIGICIFFKYIFFVVEFCNFYDRYFMFILVEIKYL